LLIAALSAAPAVGWAHEDAPTAAAENPAEEQVAEEDSRPIPLSVTIRGGSSLGAYEAGFLHFFAETMKRNPDLYDLQVVTGASAGAINTLLLAMAMGQEPIVDPTDGLFYRSWTAQDMSYPTLLDTKDAPAGAFSSGAAVERVVASVEQDWLDLNTPHEVHMGVTASRIEPLTTDIVPGLQASRQEERFAVRLRSGDGPPRASNFRWRLEGSPAQALLPLDAPLSPDYTSTAQQQYYTLAEAMLASSAFPFAFPTRNLDICYDGISPEPKRTDPICEVPETSAELRDGGVFDNAPLHLAYDIAEAGMATDADGEGPIYQEEEFFFLYLDPVNTDYEVAAVEEEEPQGTDQSEDYSLVKAILQFDTGFISYAQSAEINRLAVGHPEILQQIEVTRRSHPVASGQLANFMGFLERDFRIFDFYLGMYDAHRFLREKGHRPVREGSTADRFADGLDDMERLAPSGDLAGWRPYLCMHAVYNGTHWSDDVCKGDELRNFRILLHTSMDLMNESCDDEGAEDCASCRELPEHPPSLGHGRAGQGGRPEWEIALEGETDLDMFMRLLGERGFHFRDLGLPPEQADQGLLAIRQVFSTRMGQFSEHLGAGERALVATGAKSGLNLLAYRPAPWIVYGGLGTSVELGVSTGLGRSKRLRLDQALSVQGLASLLREDADNMVAFTPSLGPELELYGTARSQLRLGTRVGYKLSSQGGFKTEDCTLSENSLACSMPELQLFGALVGYERLRLQAGARWSPPWFADLPPEDEHLWSLMLSAGWQFLPGW